MWVLFCFCFRFVFLGPHLQHMGVPRPGVLLASTRENLSFLLRGWMENLQARGPNRSYSSDLTPRLGTSICHGCGPKKTKRKQKQKLNNQLIHKITWI